MRAVGSIEALIRSLLATIPVDALLVDAAKLRSVKRVEFVVVCETDGTMVGVITKTGVVERIAHCPGSACTTTVAAAMSKDAQSCGARDALLEVLSRMRRFGLVRFPVIDGGFKPIGVLIALDALGVLLAHEAYEGSLVRDYVMGIGYH